jgi:hypothetical protein
MKKFTITGASDVWRRVRVMSTAALVLLLAVAGCSSNSERGARISTVDVPEDLRVEGPRIAAVHAAGVQIYTCAVDAGGKPGWKFEAPEANFDNGSGLKGRHYAGPTWAADDGSKVVGRKLKEHASPGGGAVPWLILEAVGHEGSGRLSEVTFILRIHTVGGQAPGVGDAKPGDEIRVAYSADYVFYGTGAAIRAASR